MEIVVFDLNFTEMYSQGSSQWYAKISSENDLVPITRQTIIWNYDGLVYWRIYASFCIDDSLFMRSQARSFCCLHFVQISVKITFTHKQFVTTVRTFYYIKQYTFES